MYNATTSNFALCNGLYHLESKQGIQFLENGRINGVIHCASPQDGSHWMSGQVSPRIVFLILYSL